MINTELKQLNRLPSHWQNALPLKEGAGDVMIAFIELDLNSDLEFEKGLIYLTDQGLYAYKKHNLPKSDSSSNWEHWAFSQDHHLKLQDHAGVASLELVSEKGRLASWRFTLAQNPAANRLVQQYNIEKNRFLGLHDSSKDLVGQLVCPT